MEVVRGDSLGSGEGTTSAGSSSFIVAVVIGVGGLSLTGFFGGVGLANLSF